MTKAEIVAEIAKKSGIERAAVAIVVDEFMTTVKDVMSYGENVYLRGFGTFAINHRAARYQNIKQGTERLYVPEHNEPKFKPCPEFKEMVK